MPVCFDAKECQEDTIPLANIHEHQLLFMREFERQQGIAFFILHLTQRDEIYYLPLADAERFWKRAEDGGRKSFTYGEIDKSYRISGKNGLVHFLEPLQKDLLERD